MNISSKHIDYVERRLELCRYSFQYFDLLMGINLLDLPEHYLMNVILRIAKEIDLCEISTLIQFCKLLLREDNYKIIRRQIIFMRLDPTTESGSAEFTTVNFISDLAKYFGNQKKLESYVSKVSENSISASELCSIANFWYLNHSTSNLVFSHLKKAFQLSIKVDDFLTVARSYSSITNNSKTEIILCIKSAENYAESANDYMNLAIAWINLGFSKGNSIHCLEQAREKFQASDTWNENYLHWKLLKNIAMNFLEDEKTYFE